MIFRLLLVALGVVALVGSLAIERPERFAIIWPTAVLIVLLAAGSIAAHAVPLHRVGLVCAIATLVCGFFLLSRAEVQIPLAGAVVVLQAVAITDAFVRAPTRRA